LSSQVLTTQQSVAIQSWVRLLRAHAASVRSLSAQLVAEHGLTINDYEALLRLSRAEGGRLRRVDLSQELVLTASGVTRLLDGLERAGYVEKGHCDSDLRVTYAVLTEAGLAKLDEAACSHVAAITELFESRLSGDELAQLAALLGRLPGVKGADDESCSAGS
jgi:DNA-binding MarR family transcriptional regulator